ncbi:hypothetical protein CIHG_08303 [Coccidioides immitis H538.4]|uniref:RRM domain-containing protein n=1 Tax=Coccidioides immitis H538.4 TaxID=396776 RepID=A0A0J8S0G2_COCIT|nr:hypothetical protein CIHG_08303 [Coccidioides immitis H538.4]
MLTSVAADPTPASIHRSLRRQATTPPLSTMAHRPSPTSKSTTTAGLLPISPAAAAQHAPAKPASSRASAPRLKLLVRRLPPGLTQVEFETALGPEWTVGKGKLDWFAYKPGKLSADPSKPSKPSRAYLRVTASAIVPELSDRVRETSFQDSRNTFADPALLGPPTLEYAPYPRVPGGKVRKDARMGTIDQDPEFIAFLESLTNPVPKPSTDDIVEPDKDEKITITPLIQYLKDKKAGKAKEASAPARATKPSRSGAKDVKVEKVQAKKVLSRAEKAASPVSEKQQPKIDKAAKDAAKAANKQIASQASKQKGAKPAPASKQSEVPPQQPAPAPPGPPPQRKRERGNLSAATKILRRDLGLTPPRKRGEKSSTNTAATSSATDSKQAAPTPSTGGTKQQATTTKPSKENPPAKVTPPKLLKKPPTEPAAARNATKTTNPPTGPKNAPPESAKAAAPQSTATQAFLKHANPSQGVTEDLLESGFSKFGKVINVEIDKKKGFGYVDFAEPEALRKAIQASPVQIAQSQVVVLERRSTAAVAQARGNHMRNHPPPVMPAHSPSGGGAGGGGGGGGPTPARAPPQGPRGGGRGGPRNRGGYGRGRNGPGGGDRSNNANTGPKQTATAPPAKTTS